MALHSSFKELLKAISTSYMYLQHDLSDYIEIDKLEKVMQRIILKCTEITKDDRRSVAPVFTFTEVVKQNRNYVRMNIHRPGKDDKPDTILGHFDFLEVFEPGVSYPSLEIAVNKWALLSREVHQDLTAHGAKTIMNRLMDYMDPVEYGISMSPIKEILRLPAAQRVGIHFTLEVTGTGINLILMRLGKILMIHQVVVEDKEI